MISVCDDGINMSFPKIFISCLSLNRLRLLKKIRIEKDLPYSLAIRQLTYQIYINILDNDDSILS